MIFDFILSPEEAEAARVAAWETTYGPVGDKSIINFSMRFSAAVGEKGMEKLGCLELLRRAQKLPEFRRAEDGIRKGWALWLERHCGIGPESVTDKAVMRKELFVRQLRGMSAREEKEAAIRSSPVIQMLMAEDRQFRRKVIVAKSKPSRGPDDAFEFLELLLTRWLCGFFWTMPPENVARHIAEVQLPTPEDRKHVTQSAVDKFHQRLRQARTRHWEEVFITSTPHLVEFIDFEGRPVLTRLGRSMLA